jgi:DNA-3-methyladenine glycosylase I
LAAATNGRGRWRGELTAWTRFGEIIRISLAPARLSPSTPIIRCTWSGTDPLSIRYHDREWGVPVWQDRRLFEFIVLEGAQAGLSWMTILRKRDAYRAAFAEFDVGRVARYSRSKIEALLRDPGIVRNRLKVESTVTNARAFLAIQEEFGSFARYQWEFTGGRPKVNRWRTPKEIPSFTPESDAFSQDLKRRGFRFVGSTIVYAHMQAVGMVNDHTVDCFRHEAVLRLGRSRR